MKLYLRYFFSTFFSLTASLSMSSRQLSVDAAISRIQQKDAGKCALLKSTFKTEPAYTACDENHNLFYVINRGDNSGFIIVAADDCFTPLIGYATEGTFDIDSIPDNMRYMLSVCGNNIATAIASCEKVSSTLADTPAARQTPIDNLITTRWDQYWPYYNMTPTNDKGQQCLTGCVATAMAQVMNYHRYPLSGTSSHSYTWSGKTISADFAATTYDWDSMLDTYAYTSPQESIDAVAQLMFHCGVSVDMIYGANASAAIITAVPNALARYFGYDNDMKYLPRRSFNTGQWNQIIYDELAAGRPVLYSGSDPTAGGHYFICTGCDGNDNFFINWGWGGSCNMYFKLDALNAMGNKFNSDQSIVIGIKPDDGINDESSFNILGHGQLKLYYKDWGKEYTRRSNITEFFWPTGDTYGFFNYDWHGATPDFGTILESCVDDESLIIEATNYTPQRLEMGKKIMYFEIRQPEIPTYGRWRMYPAATDADGNWHKIPMDASSPQYIIVEPTATTITYLKPEEGLPHLTVTNVGYPADVKWMWQYFDIPLTITNDGTGDYSGDISLYYKHEREDYYMLLKTTANIPAGETASAKFQLKPSKIGRYMAFIRDAGSNLIVSDFPFIVKNYTNELQFSLADKPQISIGNYFDSVHQTLAEESSTLRVPVSVTAPMHCDYGYYYGAMEADIINKSSGETVTTLYSGAPRSIYEGDDTTFSLEGDMPLEYGDYRVDLIYIDDRDYPALPANNDNYAEHLSFTLDPKTTSLPTQVLTSGDESWSIYNLQGVKIKEGKGAIPSLPRGPYILVSSRGRSTIIM